MLKRGFTLAEVLITLTIIGVVATLTTPALVKNVGSSKIGPQLSKFVNTFETAIETMMMEECMGEISDESGFSMSLLSKYMIMSTLPSDQAAIKVYAPNGKSDPQTYNSASNTWQLKDGTIVIPYFGESGNSYNASGAYKGRYASIYVDIGGIKGKHRAGKEVFVFLLDKSGILIPYASNANKALYTGTSPFASCSQNSSSRDAGLACTGAIADNGYKAPW